MGALSRLNAETLERAPTPLFGEKVRCSAHGRTFARVRYQQRCEADLLPYQITPSLSFSDRQYIKILCVSVCVCVCVCVMEVGCSWSGTRLVTRDLRNSEPRTRLRILENIQAWAGTAGAAIGEQYIVEADAIGEQQLKRML